MLTLKNEAEIYRIGLIIGYFVKCDVIDWVDKLIDTQESVEYEFIELSLLASSSKIEIASKLFDIKGIANEQIIINVFLGLCSSSYNSNEFNEDEICTFLYRLISSKIDISISSEIEETIHYLSDGYYLATEGIYGSLEDICSELKKFLDKYTAYAKEFRAS